MRLSLPLVLLCSVFLFLTDSMLAQEGRPAKPGPVKRSVLIESEYSVLSPLLGGGTGVGIFADGGTTVTSIGFDGGYFVADRLAILFSLAVISADGSSISSFGTGAKYYIKDQVPVTLEFGLLSGDGSIFTAGAGVGYAFRIAPNIRLEPNAGIRIADAEGFFSGGAKFAFFL